VDNISGLLKAFVIVGGVVLLLGSALLVALLILRGNQERERRAVAPAALDVALPAGSRIEQVSMDGERLVLLAVDGAGRQFVAVVDPRTGERLSLIRIQPAE
jgi:hypothetical protein